MKKQRKRLIFSIPEELHRVLKLHCAERNVSMTKYILQCVAIRLKKEGK